MTTKEKLEKVLELQSKGMTSKDIAQHIGVSSGALRSFMSRQGYKSDNGVFVSKEDDINQISLFKEETKELPGKKTKSKKQAEPKENSKKEVKKSATNVEKSKSTKTKKDATKEVVKKETTKKSRKVVKTNAKINLSQEDMDKLCEVYDWYLSIKDIKSLNPKKKSSKDLIIEKEETCDWKTTTIKVDKNIWQDFERLCTNSEHSRQDIIGQAIKDYLKDNKHLI